MTWIPVSERLPEPGSCELLIVCDKDGVTVARYMSGFWYEALSDDGDRLYVTHWQPLPEPPEKEGAWSKS